MTTDEITEKLRQWRQVKKNNREPIPKAIWDAAVKLAGETSYTKVAGETGLSTSDLKRKMGIPVISKKFHQRKIATPKFKQMKLTKTPAASVASPVFELKMESGLTLKVFR